ncbi:MAG TPA: hypothetical protein VJ997_10420, partial [Longimicrobiales bacterium]|nr:hypothetical protein [Longimicrobiales bacterium]
AVAGAIVFGLWWMYSGGPSYVLQIDYAFTGDLMEGAEVVVDDSVVGTLEGPGRNRVVGFRLSAGEHVVDLRGPGCTFRPDTVTVGPSRIQVLVLDFDDRLSGCSVFFR